MHNNPIGLTDVRGLGPDGDGVAVATTNDGLAKADPAGNPVVFNPAEVKEIALVTTSGTFTLKDGTTTYVAEGSVLGYWDKDDKFHSATYQKNSDGDNYFVGYGSEKGTSGVKSSPSGAYFVGGVPENFKGESTKVACGNVERESVMGDDFKGNPLMLEASIIPEQALEYGGQILNGGQAIVGAGELLTQNARTFKSGQGPKLIARQLGTTTGKVADKLRSAVASLSKAGKRLGAIGTVLSVVTYFPKVFNKEKITDGQHATFWVGIGVTALAVAVPATAVVALVYGVAELVCWFKTRQSIEERFIDGPKKEEKKE